MPATTKFEKRNEQAAFVLKYEDIARIFHAMAQFAPHVTCSGDCMDGAKPEFTLESIREYPNSPASAIRALRFHSYGWDMEWQSEGEKRSLHTIDRSASVEFVTSEGKEVVGVVILRNTIKISVEGPTKYTEPWKKSIDDILSGTQPWYHRLAFKDPNSLGCLFTLVAWYGSILALAIWTERHKSHGSYTPVLLLLASVFFWAWVFSKISDAMARTFPRCVIAINKSLEKHDGWRWLVISGVLVGFIVNLVAGIVVSRWV